jgi:hypothetical protein
VPFSHPRMFAQMGVDPFPQSVAFPVSEVV